MAETTADDPIRELAKMASKDPEIARFLYGICDLYDKHGQWAVDLLLDTTDQIAEQLVDERRVAFRVIEGGE